MANPLHVFKPEGNAWLQQLEDQIVLCPSHVFEYIRTDGYKRSVGKIITCTTKNKKNHVIYLSVNEFRAER